MGDTEECPATNSLPFDWKESPKVALPSRLFSRYASPDRVTLQLIAARRFLGIPLARVSSTKIFLSPGLGILTAGPIVR